MKRTAFWIGASLLVGLMTTQQLSAQTTVDETVWWSSSLGDRLDEAGTNIEELRQALRQCPVDQRDELAFLVEHMPNRDLRSLSASFLLQNIQLACEARQQAPWQIPDSLFLNDVLPYACADETREAWRQEMRDRCFPLVAECPTCSAAALKLNRELFPLVNVRYATSREKANQSPSESMRQSVASCTGLSILLVDACRSVGVPARLAGTPSWTTKRGNHTWVEIWDGDWHFVGAAEPDDRGLDHGWFVGDASRADNDQPMNRIYATSFAETGMHFPLVWSRRDSSVPGVNVTRRYTAGGQALPDGLARVLVAAFDEAGQRVAADVRVRYPNEVDAALEGVTRAGTADMNDVLEFELRCNASCEVTLRWNDQQITETRDVGDVEQALWRFQLKDAPPSATPSRADK
jgi:hypothetical protein